jgi:hypothetical protein
MSNQTTLKLALPTPSPGTKEAMEARKKWIEAWKSLPPLTVGKQTEENNCVSIDQLNLHRFTNSDEGDKSSKLYTPRSEDREEP